MQKDTELKYTAVKYERLSGHQKLITRLILSRANAVLKGHDIITVLEEENPIGAISYGKNAITGLSVDPDPSYATRFSKTGKQLWTELISQAIRQMQPEYIVVSKITPDGQALKSFLTRGKKPSATCEDDTIYKLTEHGKKFFKPILDIKK